MTTQKTETTNTSESTERTTKRISSEQVDFDDWAVAVRQQLLDSLKKRGSRY